jgi:site-specific DNA recombinase
MNKAATYLRVSTEGQLGPEKFGLESQREDITNYCRHNNIEIIQEFVEEGVSGSKEIRPALSELFIASKKEEFQYVIVAKLDRIARDLMLQLFIEKELLKHDIQIISVAEPFRADDYTGKLMRSIIGAFAEFERGRITERLTSGKVQKAKTGGYSGGRPPLGYEAQNKQLVLNEQKVEIVKYIFMLKNIGFGYQKISAETNRMFKTDILYPMRVKRILSNDKYRGFYTYKGITVQGKQEAIV